jgi:hypothetical protein
MALAAKVTNELKCAEEILREAKVVVMYTPGKGPFPSQFPAFVVGKKDARQHQGRMTPSASAKGN